MLQHNTRIPVMLKHNLRLPSEQKPTATFMAMFDLHNVLAQLDQAAATGQISSAAAANVRIWLTADAMPSMPPR